MRREVGADDAVRAASIVDDDLLADALTQLDADVTREHVVAAARRKRNDPAYLALGKVLGRARAPGRGPSRAEAERDSKRATNHPHLAPPPVSCNPALSQPLFHHPDRVSGTLRLIQAKCINFVSFV